MLDAGEFFNMAVNAFFVILLHQKYEKRSDQGNQNCQKKWRLIGIRFVVNSSSDEMS